ncbi:MAG: hypothetical protein Q4E44_06925 [bacterium]|nr:hypothetical protein [bacterium]
MRHSKENIKILIDKFFDGQSTEEDEQVLSDFFCNGGDVPEEWETYKLIFMSFKTDAYDFSEDELEAMLSPSPAIRMNMRRRWRWVSIACVSAILLAIAYIGTTPIHGQETECIVYANGKRVSDKSEIERIMDNTIDDMKTESIAETQLEEMFMMLD